MKKKILITGGAGFLGSHLCKKLLDEGNQVLCVDNLFTGQQRNIESYLKNPDFIFTKRDINEPFEFEADEVYNLACPASPVHYQHDPVFTFKTSVLGLMNILDQVKSKSTKVFQASTSEIYGDPSVHPQTEDYWGNVNPIGIRSCYDEGKRSAETLMFDYHRKYGTRIKVVRIFNTYGPHMHPEDGRVVSNFIIQALRGTDITIFGDGKQTRSFCYVDDLIEAFVRMMNTSDQVTGPINTGNPHEFTMIELAELVLKLTKSKSKLIFKPLPQDDPKQRKPDISMAKRELGSWEPRVNLEEGLLKTIEYFRGFV